MFVQRLSLPTYWFWKNIPETICNSTRVVCPLTFKDLILDNTVSKLIKPSFIQISLEVSASHQFQSTYTYIYGSGSREFVHSISRKGRRSNPTCFTENRCAGS